MVSVLVKRKPDRKSKLDGIRAGAVKLVTAGAATNVSVSYDSTLGAKGKDLAAAVLKTAQADYDRVWVLFGLLVRPSVTVLIEPLSDAHDGTGGAYHMTCEDTTCHVDADFARPERTSALYVAELAEVLMAATQHSWDCGHSNGEGLSRVVAEWAYPGALDDYTTAGAWLDSARNDFVTSSVQSDTDDTGNGCAVLFLWWLRSKGLPLDAICQTGGNSLADTYTALEQGTSAWQDFRAACLTRWPVGSPSGVTTDNPWPASAPPAKEPPKPPGQTASQVFLTGQDPAGVYLLVPLTQRVQTVVMMNACTLPQLQTCLAKLLECLLECLLPNSGSASLTVNKPKEADFAGYATAQGGQVSKK